MRCGTLISAGVPSFVSANQSAVRRTTRSGFPPERGRRLVGTVYAKLNRHAKADSSWSRENERASTGYVVVVTISRMGIAVSPFSPLRLGESDGPAFSSDTDALMVGYSAAQRIVDDLLSADTDQR
jgi:hypothetical protein